MGLVIETCGAKSAVHSFNLESCCMLWGVNTLSKTLSGLVSFSFLVHIINQVVAECTKLACGRDFCLPTMMIRVFRLRTPADTSDFKSVPNSIITLCNTIKVLRCITDFETNYQTDYTYCYNYSSSLSQLPSTQPSLVLLLNPYICILYRDT